MVKRLAVGLMVALCALVFVSPVLVAKGQAPTATYTPIATRTPPSSVSSVTEWTIDDSHTATLANTISTGEVGLIIAVAAVFVMLGMRWAYDWAKDHIKVQG